jgi:hypothetical protein
VPQREDILAAIREICAVNLASRAAAPQNGSAARPRLADTDASEALALAYARR